MSAQRRSAGLITRRTGRAVVLGLAGLLAIAGAAPSTAAPVRPANGAQAVTAGSTTAARAAAATGSLGIISDDFTRSTIGGWGYPAAGGQYISGLSNSLLSVSSGIGWMKNVKPGGAPGAYDATAVSLHTKAQVVVRSPAITASRVNTIAAIELRRQTDGTSYRGRVEFRPNGAVALSISRYNHTADRVLVTRVLPFKISPGTEVTLVFQVSGVTPVTLRAGAARGRAAPSLGMLTYTDSSSSRIARSGNIALRSMVGRTSLTSTIGFDVLRAWNLAAGPATPRPARTSTYAGATFDGYAAGRVDPQKFIRDIGPGNPNQDAYRDMSIVPAADGRVKALSTLLKAGTVHSKPNGPNGAVFFPSMRTPVDRACMSYDLRFDARFEWSLGGKLPGLQGVAPGVAPSVPTGGGSTSQGWSGRMMWVGAGAYSWAKPSNMAVSYLYHPGQSGTYGDNILWHRAFTPGAWYAVKQCYAMNTPGKANGVLQAWINGVLVVNRKNFVYRTSFNVHITHVSWAIFRGGSTLDWASSRDGWVYLDNVAITNR